MIVNKLLEAKFDAGKVWLLVSGKVNLAGQEFIEKIELDPQRFT